MASIRLFGRGKNAAAAAGGASAVGAGAIADVLESLAAASMSTTWRCRHSAGVSIGEGAVDFAAARSRSTVIRGKYAFEYVRSGSSVFRAPVTDEDAGLGASAGAQARADVDGVREDDDAEVDESLEAEGSEGGGELDFEDAESDVDAEDELDEDEADAEEEDAGFEGSEDGDSGEDGEDEDGASDEEQGEVEPESEAAASAPGSASSAGSVWERFSDHDACGVHAYAEPAVLAAGVRASGVVQAREAQEFDGVKLAAYAVTLKPKPGDPNRVLARLARHLRDHGANVLVVTAFVDESESIAATDDDAEPGGEGGPRIVRLRIELPHWTPADDPTADHSVSVDLFEFGEPVRVEVPEGAGRRMSRSCADLGLF